MASSFRTAIDAAPMRRTQVVIVALAIISLITDGFDTQAMGNVAPVLLKSGMIGRATMGYIFSAGTLGLTIGTILFGTIADHLGTKRVILGCTALYGVCTLALAFVQTPEAFLVLRALAGLGLGGVMPCAIALASEYVPRRLCVTLVASVVAGFAFGGSLGGFLSAFLIPRFGWPSVFVLGGLVPLALLIPALAVWMPESMPHLLRRAPIDSILRVTRPILPDWRPLPADLGRGGAQQKVSVSRLFDSGYKLPTCLFWSTYFANLLLLYFLASWLPTMINFSGLTIEAANLTTGVYQFSGLIGSVLLGWLADRARPQLVLCCGFLASAVALAGVSFSAHQEAGLVVCVFAAGFCVIGGQAALNGFAATFYPPEVRTTGQGWAVGIGRIGSIVGPLIGGFLIAANVAPPQVFRLCIAASLAAAGLVVFIARPRPQAEPALEYETASNLSGSA